MTSPVAVSTPARPLRPSLLPPAWARALPPLVLLLAWILFVYRDAGLAMVEIWSRSNTFAHAFLVPPIGLWLVWRQRALLRPLQPRPDGRWIAVAAGLGAALLTGQLAAANAITQLAFTGLLVAAVPALLGVAVARTLLFPLAFLFFAVPIGEFMLPQLMSWTADFTVFALRASGIPVYREGLQFVIPSGNWSVVEACSGVRYLIASLMVGTLFAYLNYRSNARRWMFVGVSIAVPLLANWVRAYGIVLLGHLSGNQLATGVDHLIYGWLFFGIVVSVMFVIGMRWADAPVDAEPAAVPVAMPAAPSSALASWATAAALAAVVALPQLAWQRIESAESAAVPPLAVPESLAGGWRRDPLPLADWKPVYIAPRAEIDATFTDGRQRVGLYIARYRRQDARSKLISSDNVLVHSANTHWAPVASESGHVEVAGRAVDRVATEIRPLGPGTADDGRRLIAWRLYWVAGTWTADDHAAKAWTAWHRLRGDGDDSAAVVVYALKAEGGAPDAGKAALTRFMQANFVALDALLHRVPAGP